MTTTDLAHRAAFVTPDLQAPTADLGALCAQTDPESFFPEKGGTAGPARETCQRCPLTEMCLEWALATQERYGVWGGMSERERRAETRRRAEVAGETLPEDIEDDLTELDDDYPEELAA